MTLIKFHNPTAAHALNPWFEDVFGSFLNPLSDRQIARVPAVNIAETDSAYQLELAAPGLKKEDFKISLDKNTLSISAENLSEDNEESKKYSRREYHYTSFTRSFTLSEEADPNKIDAEYLNGILKITIAKAEEAKNISRTIAVK